MPRPPGRSIRKESATGGRLLKRDLPVIPFFTRAARRGQSHFRDQRRASVADRCPRKLGQSPFFSRPPAAVPAGSGSSPAAARVSGRHRPGKHDRQACGPSLRRSRPTRGRSRSSLWDARSSPAPRRSKACKSRAGRTVCRCGTCSPAFPGRARWQRPGRQAATARPQRPSMTRIASADFFLPCAGRYGAFSEGETSRFRPRRPSLCE